MPCGERTGVLDQSEPVEPSHIGPRLRGQREQLGLSLREIARRIGVSASLISQIERDKVNPSVGTLYALSASSAYDGRPLRERSSRARLMPAAPAGSGPVVRPSGR